MKKPTEATCARWIQKTIRLSESEPIVWTVFHPTLLGTESAIRPTVKTSIHVVIAAVSLLGLFILGLFGNQRVTR